MTRTTTLQIAGSNRVAMTVGTTARFTHHRSAGSLPSVRTPTRAEVSG
ncbi:hypothetical protein RBH26_13425 [Natronolimnohabitans sp. A-GB9]|nr:hypothetical protein [Natronolimnohabitans sp. A-GB9]MDQ2051479.1 hypothetical protein [Natronolimnohabitans sp. A-GB9]